MSVLSVSERYRPAFLSEGKETMIVYWVRNPVTHEWQRVKEKLNYIRDQAERKRYGQRRVRDLNLKLGLGWNPMLDKTAPRAATPVREALTAFLATKEREEKRLDSMRSYRSLCGIFSTWLQRRGRLEAAVGSLTEDEAVAFMDDSYAERNLSARTFNNYRMFFTTLCRWWVKHKYAQSNIFANVERKRSTRRKNRRPFTLQERQKVREYMEVNHPRFMAFSLIVFHCALRPKEAFYLKPHNVDLVRGTITVEAFFSKNGEERVACIPNVLLPAMQQLGLNDQDQDHYIFSTHFCPGEVLKRSTYSGKHWDKVRERLNLPKELKHYSLRDTAVLQLARDGVSRVDSQNHYGHSSSTMQDIYSMHQQPEGNTEVRLRATAF